MTTYITELSAIVAAMTGTPEFAHETVHMQNVNMDAETGVVVFAPFLALGNFDLRLSGIASKQKIILEFLQQTQFENDLTQNQSIIDDMYDLALEFIQRINASTVLKPTKNNDGVATFDTEYVYEIFDANFAGIAITFDCEIRQPYSICVP